MIQTNLYPTLHAQHRLHSIIISTQDVLDVIRHLDVNKACGPDLISPRLLREGANILADPFSIVFNRSLLQGYFPPPWKDANLSPIHKKDDKSSPINYKPISLLNHEGKAMERCVHKHLYNYVVSHQLLTPFQSGFCARRFHNLPTTPYLPHNLRGSGQRQRSSRCLLRHQ